MPVGSEYQPVTAILSLGPNFYDPVQGAAFPRHIQRYRNQMWAKQVGLGDLTAEEWTQHFAAFFPLPDNLTEPLALRYHGHQFRHYNPELGDGRGFLFAQMRDADGRLLDLGTKGSGRTPYSRGGDGRLTLKGGVREILATEMLEALGVNTSKTMSIIETGESLHRHDEPSPTRACILFRLGHSHIRFGTFQRYAYLREEQNLRRLVDYTIEQYYPHLGPHSEPLDGAEDPVKSTDTVAILLQEVVRRCATTCASWMSAGFVHGVLNTDNMNITGESFDYGPYRFAPSFDPDFTAAYFDHGGLYAFGRQADAVFWNLQQLATAWLPLSSTDALVRVLQTFPACFEDEWQRLFLQRLGVSSRSAAKDSTLFEFTLAFLQETQIQLDQFFFDWYGGIASESRAKASPVSKLYDNRQFSPVKTLLESYQPSHIERLHHPYFQQDRPCSMLIDEIETIWSAIAQEDDWSLLEQKLGSIRQMGEALGSYRPEVARLR